MKHTSRHHKAAPAVRRFRSIASTTVGAVIFLILVGALVRMTGSGMGCPDWPTCFGQWVPPTELAQLPADYKTRFAVAGKEIADFDAFKTWVEYVNRLLGVLIGIFALATVAAALPLRKAYPQVFRLSLAGLLAVIIVGGVGAYVVRTDLQAGVVTVHMVLALGALSLFLLALLWSYRPALAEQVDELPEVPPRATTWASLTLALVLVQIVMGTQVREEIDVIAKALGEGTRDQWIAQLGIVYDWHSLSYYAILGALVMLGVQLRPILSDWKALNYLYTGLWLVVADEVLLGLGMHHFDIPAWMQPAHLLLATLLYAGSVAVTMLLRMRQRLPSSQPLLHS